MENRSLRASLESRYYNLFQNYTYTLNLDSSIKIQSCLDSARVSEFSLTIPRDVNVKNSKWKLTMVKLIDIVKLRSTIQIFLMFE